MRGALSYLLTTGVNAVLESFILDCESCGEPSDETEKSNNTNVKNSAYIGFCKSIDAEAMASKLWGQFYQVTRLLASVLGKAVLSICLPIWVCPGIYRKSEMQLGWYPLIFASWTLIPCHLTDNRTVLDTENHSIYSLWGQNTSDKQPCLLIVRG